MKQNKRIIILALLITVLFAGCSNLSERAYVAVIVKSTESNFWKTVYSGAKTASNEFNIEFTFEGPDNEEDYKTQNRLIEEAINKGAKTIILSAISYTESVDVIEKAISKGIYIVIIDSDINSDKVNVHITTDNYASGQMIGEVIKESNLDEIYVGIVNFDENSENGQEREQGFRDMISEDERVNILETINVESNIESATLGTKELIEKYPKINAIVTLNEWTTLGVGYAIEEMDASQDIMAIGFDSNIVSLGMLETGEMDALIVQNPFAMGYLGIENAYSLINDKISGQDVLINTTTTIITRNNMFDEASQKILFPFE